MELIESIIESIPAWLNAIFALVTAASLIAALTPTPKDDAIISKALAFIRKVANLFAINVGNAKPKDDSK